MMTSGGGGYCDCGDPEAWKQHPNCEIHMPKQKSATASSSALGTTSAAAAAAAAAASTGGEVVDESSYEASIEKLPKDLVQRGTELFQFLIDYVFEILGMENAEELPAHLKPEYFII